MKTIKRRYVTLIEMMIVMFLIALITGVVAYNYRATLEKGRAFKTEQGIEKVKTILLLAVAENPEETWSKLEEGRWEEVLRESPLTYDWKALSRDGWGYRYEVTADEKENYIEVRSERYDEYIRAQGESQRS